MAFFLCFLAAIFQVTLIFIPAFSDLMTKDFIGDRPN
jgi:hypothetical protein